MPLVPLEGLTANATLTNYNYDLGRFTGNVFTDEVNNTGKHSLGYGGVVATRMGVRGTIEGWVGSGASTTVIAGLLGLATPPAGFNLIADAWSIVFDIPVVDDGGFQSVGWYDCHAKPNLKVTGSASGELSTSAPWIVANFASPAVLSGFAGSFVFQAYTGCTFTIPVNINNISAGVVLDDSGRNNASMSFTATGRPVVAWDSALSQPVDANLLLVGGFDYSKASTALTFTYATGKTLAGTFVISRIIFARDSHNSSMRVTYDVTSTGAVTGLWG